MKNLGICGDYFNYNNLEATFLSSELLGNVTLIIFKSTYFIHNKMLLFIF